MELAREDIRGVGCSSVVGVRQGRLKDFPVSTTASTQEVKLLPLVSTRQSAVVHEVEYSRQGEH